mmetsp:Transcript_10706/g.23525  ORF Transcript_10706/g.23525 Transcript_10706/m.23525 type:complete len:110 (-) Transcript_10706:682-1011(-)
MYDIQLYNGQGLREDLFQWCMSIESYFSRAGITEVTDMFALIPKCLDHKGEVQQAWERCKDKAISTAAQNKDGLWAKLGETEVGFDQTKLRSFMHFLPKLAADDQKRYL